MKDTHIGRLSIQHLHRSKKWRQGFRISWRCKPRPGEENWIRRYHFIQLEIQ